MLARNIKMQLEQSEFLLEILVRNLLLTLAGIVLVRSDYVHFSII